MEMDPGQTQVSRPLPTTCAALIAALKEMNSAYSNNGEQVQGANKSQQQIAFINRFENRSLHRLLRFDLVPGSGKPWSQPLMEVLCELTPLAILELRKRVFFKDLLPSPEAFYNHFYLYSAGARIHFLWFAGELTPKLAQLEPGFFVDQVVTELLPSLEESVEQPMPFGPHKLFLHIDGPALLLQLAQDLKDTSDVRDYFDHLRDHALLKQNTELLTHMLYVLHSHYDASERYSPAWQALKNAWLEGYHQQQRPDIEALLQQRLSSSSPSLSRAHEGNRVAAGTFFSDSKDAASHNPQNTAPASAASPKK